MSDDNPFSVSTHSGAYGTYENPNNHPQLQALIRLLIETRPWVRFFGVLTMICAVLLLIGGLFMVGGAGLANAGVAEMTGMGAAYLVCALLYIYPGLCLNRYASAITQAETTGHFEEVVEAISQQKKFWRFVGIIATVILIIYLMIFVFAILGAAFFAR